MKNFISMILFFISCITFQTHTMELDEFHNHKESTSSQHLLTAINTSPQSIEIPESITRYQNNYVTFPSAQNTVIFPLYTANENKAHERKDEYEFIPLHDIQNNDREENFSKYQSCCIPLTKEKIDINLCHNGCGKEIKKNKFSVSVGLLTVCLFGSYSIYLLWAALYDCGFLICPNNTRVPIICGKPFPHC